MLGQKKLLAWTVPGIAHVFAFWGFIVLGITVVGAFGELYIENFFFPIIGQWWIVLFAEDLFACLVLVGIVIFALIRLRNNPAKEGRYSRFFGSHTGAAWLVLFMIFMVVFTLLMYRGAKVNNFGDMNGRSPRIGLRTSSTHSARLQTNGSKPSSCWRTSASSWSSC